MLQKLRTQLALAAAAAALPIGAGVLSATGNAQSTTSPSTLHFIATEIGSFESKGHFGPGSVAGFTDRLRADDGTIGRDVGVCTITNLQRKEAFCHVIVGLPQGQLVLELLNRESSTRQDVAVVGGTGVYAGARGSAVVREIGRKTDITVSLAG